MLELEVALSTNMDRLPYSRLSEHYDLGWGDFAESCQRFVLSTLHEHGLDTGRILELACGTGILAITLAKAGYEVLGIDRSLEMVTLANEKAAFVNGVRFAIADMRLRVSERAFDGALCLFDSVNYLATIEDVSEMLATVSAALATDGLFIFDFNRPLIYSAHHGKTLYRKIRGGILRQKLHYDPEARIARTQFHFPDGDTETHIQRAYEMDELEPLLDGSNFAVEGCFSSFSRQRVSLASERIICVCLKKALSQIR